jgi:nicotinamide mononucleotide adenylyltransferase
VAIDVNEEAAKREAWMHARDVISGKGDPVAPVLGWQPWVSVLGMDWHRSGLEGKHFTFNHNVHIYDRHLYHRAELVRKMNPSAVWLYLHDDHDFEAWVDGLIRYLCGWHSLGKLI